MTEAAPDNLKLAVNAALAIHVNRMGGPAQGFDRMQWAQMLSGGIDQKHPQSWCEYGFPENINPQNLYGLYKRRGIAYGAVNKLSDKCFETYPEVIEGSEKKRNDSVTPWETSLGPVIAGGRLWSQVAKADKRRLAGRYAGILLRVRDSAEWNQPVNGAAKELVEAKPVWGVSLTPKTYDETTGAVSMWTYTEDKRGSPSSRDVHPDRVFILGDYSSEAIGFLEPAYNNLITLEKVEGGSGESFLKNAARQLSVNFDRDIDLAGLAKMHGVKPEDLHKAFDDAVKSMNRSIDSMFVTQGAQVAPLVSAISDPGPTYDINLQSACAAFDIPTKIVVGMQTGERASSEDQKYFNARCQSRRRDLGFELYEFVNHLTRIGVIAPIAEFSIVWSDLTQQTVAERLAAAKSLAEINKIAFDTGASNAVFSEDEVRGAAGYDPQKVQEPMGERDAPEADDELDPTDPPADDDGAAV